MSRPAFQTIGLLGKYHDPRVAECMVGLARHLADRSTSVLMRADAAAEFDDLPVEACEEHTMVERADLIVAIGGDGTMLHAARLVAGRDVPLLGVNRGRLGFLADVSPKDMRDRVDDVLDGRHTRETRLLLKARLLSRDNHAIDHIALNDVVLQRSNTGRMLDFETWIDGHYVNTHGGDGLIVATPTGSTAYALSCGGPIIHPNVDAVVLAPICPHTLSDRPLLVRAEAIIEIRLLEHTENGAQITCDGRLIGDLGPGDGLKIEPAPDRITLIHPPGHDYYKILRSKLHWGRGSRTNPQGG